MLEGAIIIIIRPITGQPSILLYLCPPQIAFQLFLPESNNLTLECRLGFGVTLMEPPAHRRC